MALSTILVTLDNGQHTFLQHNTQCVALVTVVLTWDPEKVGHYNCASALNGVNRLNWASKFSEIKCLMWCWPRHQLSNDGLDKKTWAYHPYPEYNTIALRPAAEWKARNSQCKCRWTDDRLFSPWDIHRSCRLGKSTDCTWVVPKNSVSFAWYNSIIYYYGDGVGYLTLLCCHLDLFIVRIVCFTKISGGMERQQCQRRSIVLLTFVVHSLYSIFKESLFQTSSVLI